jgi:hypothetical protein
VRRSRGFRLWRWRPRGFQELALDDGFQLIGVDAQWITRTNCVEREKGFAQVAAIVLGLCAGERHIRRRGNRKRLFAHTRA